MKFLFLGTEEDKEHAWQLKTVLAGHDCVPVFQTPMTVAEVQVSCMKFNVDAVICSNQEFLKKLIPNKKGSTLENYQGSIIKRAPIPITKKEMEFLIINPLKQLRTIPYGKHCFERYITKFTKPDSWWKPTAFEWEVATASNIDRLYLEFSGADLIAVDIETRQHDLAITICGYAAVWFATPDANGIRRIRIKSIVLPINDIAMVYWMRRFNLLPAPKIFQNGMYDNAYFIRYDAPIFNYAFDTLNLFHCWLSELPKDLGFIAGYTMRDLEFWKLDGDGGDKLAQFRYNARDTWGTANAFLSIINEGPDWMLANYLLEFPIVFPSIAFSAEGWRIDTERMAKVKQEQEQKLEHELSSIKRMVSPYFNPSSPAQCLRLLHALGHKDIKTTEEKYVKKAMLRHAVTGRIFTAIFKYRKARKLIGTYLEAENAASWKGGTRCLYSLNPAATDTGRLSSREHYFWQGVNITQVPRGPVVKQCYLSDDGFLTGEADYDQAEARDTAYLSGDLALIQAVEDSSHDFHSYNASKFFGIPYEKLCLSTKNEQGQWKHSRLDLECIDIAKRINHGSNYNMAEQALIDTMGLDRIWAAQSLLKLPAGWEPKDVAKYLLGTYIKKYPGVKGDWYDYVIFQVLSTNKLVSPFGWTRYCFANPKTSKPALNAYVAHPPQNLNAGTLNRAVLKVFLRVQLPNWNNFRIKAQIHDSIPFQYRKGHENLALQVKEIMEEPLTVTDCKGIVRTVTIPVTLKLGAERWSEIK